MHIKCSLFLVVAVIVTLAKGGLFGPSEQDLLDALARKQIEKKRGQMERPKEKAIPEIRPKKLYAIFDELNKYLDENVPSGDPEAMMTKIEELHKNKLSKKLTILNARPIVRALDMLQGISKTTATNWDRELYLPRNYIFEKVDSGLAGRENQNSNYPMTKLDKLIEYYGYKEALGLGYDGHWPRMSYTYKQSAYDNINQYLVDNLPDTDDVDANMAKAEEYLDNMDSKDGALARALKQFLMLRSTLSEQYCNAAGLDILFKNDLATRGKGHASNRKEKRRVEKIFQHFVLQHEQLCWPGLRENVSSGLKQLDQDTYRRVLGLVSVFYVGAYKLPQLLESLNQKEVDEDFTGPLMVDFAHNPDTYSNTIQLKEYRIETRFLMPYLEAIYKSEGKPGQEGIDERVAVPPKPEIVFNRYLLEPCRKYISVLGELMDIDAYWLAVLGQNPKRTLLTDISYHVVRAGYQACKPIVTNPNAVLFPIDSYLKL